MLLTHTGADVRAPFHSAIKTMTRFDDELEYVCAWGRWRIDQARNEPVLPAERRHAPGPRQFVDAQRARSVLRRGRARLRLVTAGSPAKLGAVR